MKTEAVSEREAYAIGVEAYLYFYPLVTMDLTRRQFTNVPAGKVSTAPGRGPPNAFSHIRAYPPSTFKEVVRPNFDTLYSLAWLDLTGGPVIVSAPDTRGRYYMLPMLDMWSDVFANPGSRTTGTRAARFLVAPPGWKGAVPRGVERVNAPTPYVWIIGRTRTDGPTDYPEVNRIQSGYTVTPLGKRRKPARFDPRMDMKTPPLEQVDAMPADRYFTYAADLLRLHPPHATDTDLVWRMRRIGIVPGKRLAFQKLAPAVRKALGKAQAGAQELMRWALPRMARVVNGWQVNTDTMGVYGNYYLKRAVITQVGLGANPPADAVYPLNLGDESGKPLTGAHRYVIHFAKGATPPVDAFWSVTLYDAEGFPVPNALDRQALSSWMPFQRNADGSLDLHVQSDSPGADREANWLPAPKGPFNLAMRLYAPHQEILTGKWDPPPVKKVS